MQKRILLSVGLAAIVSVTVAQEQAKPWAANPELVAKKSKRPSEFNYVEAKVPKYTLPDSLTFQDGTPVESAEQWQAKRRAELMELFRDQVYGRRPSTKYALSFRETARVDNAFDGKATGQSMIASIAIGQRKFEFPFVQFTPNVDHNDTPVVVFINNRYFVPMEKAIAESDPFWPVEEFIKRGYATVSFHTSNVDPDKKDGYADGVRSFFADGKPPEDDAWRSLSAWGWAASRLLDHLEKDPRINARKAAVVGHSRGGKTSLWAACEDTRFAIGYSNNSGCGGAALSRRRYGETVGRITTAFPHWFCKNYWAYAGREQDLPVDQHQVMALIAPRAVYVTSADEDLWADPRGEYTSLVQAAPVFNLLGSSSITNAEMPALGKPRHEGKTGYHIRSGGHGLGELDWRFFLDFADTQFKQ